VTPAEFLNWLGVAGRATFLVYGGSRPAYHLQSPISLDRLRSEAIRVQGGVAVVVDPPLPRPPGHVGKWGARASECDRVRVLRAEGDGPDGLHFAPWRVVGLPAPNVLVSTGGKSRHLYWRLPEPVSHAAARMLHRRLHSAWRDWPAFGCDLQVASIARPMRLPGTQHPRSGLPCSAQLLHRVPLDLSRLPPDPSPPPPSGGGPLLTRAGAWSGGRGRGPRWLSELLSSGSPEGDETVLQMLEVLGPLGPVGSGTYTPAHLRAGGSVIAEVGVARGRELLAAAGWDLDRVDSLICSGMGTGAGAPRSIGVLIKLAGMR